MSIAKLLVRIIVGLIFVGSGSILLWLIIDSNKSFLIDIPVVSAALFLVLAGLAIIIKPKAIKGVAEILALWV